ncbi:MAG: GGDEF domain-containing protein [Chloroflexi bacterium]|nr:GGDEF domain-containing protein [Chloroflexota bacterium]
MVSGIEPLTLASTTECIVACDAVLRVQLWNDAMARATGIPAAVARGARLVDLAPRLDHSGELRLYEQALEGRAILAGNRRHALPDLGDEGLFEASYTPLCAPDGGVCGVVAVIRDIAERHAPAGPFGQGAFYDAVTGLPNRYLFMDRLGHALVRRSGDLTVCMLDIIDFREVNARHGHVAGDHLLELAGQRLEDCLRPSDTVSRCDAARFLLLLEDAATADSAARIASRVQAAMEQPFALHETDVRVAVRIGVSLSKDLPPPTLPDRLVRRAERALAQAKGPDAPALVIHGRLPSFE